MIIGTGIDIVEIERVQRLKDKWKERFLTRLFTDRELAYASGKRCSAEHLGARIAVKEALIKAFSGKEKKYLGRWKDIEVSNTRSGRPYVNLYGNFQEIKNKFRVEQVVVSTSHTHKYAVASVLLVR